MSENRERDGTAAGSLLKVQWALPRVNGARCGDVGDEQREGDWIRVRRVSKRQLTCLPCGTGLLGGSRSWQCGGAATGAGPRWLGEDESAILPRSKDPGAIYMTTQ